NKLDVFKDTVEENCTTDCSVGSEYKKLDETKCCGECVKYACVIDGEFKDGGEIWYSEDYCTEYFCVDNYYDVKNVSIRCEGAPPDDNIEYIYQREPVEGECCGRWEKTACGIHGQTYTEGQSWTSPSDPCVTITCSKGDADQLTKKVATQTCYRDCKPGEEYRTPSDECCGRCVPVYCISEDGPKTPGEQWISADFCMTYKCVAQNETLSILSSEVKCPKPPKDEGYQYDIVKPEDECCVEYKKVGCIIEGEVYKVGQNLTKTEEKGCIVIECVEDETGDIVKKEKEEKCVTNCPLGHQYTKVTGKCCGECKQNVCIWNGQIKEVGTTWTSENTCINYTCTVVDGEFSVIPEHPSCPNFPEDCPADRIVEKDCCKICGPSAENKVQCGPEAMKLDYTIRLIEESKGIRTKCTNHEAIDNLMQCIGSCDSHTKFNSLTGAFETECNCCQATSTMPLTIELQCTDGTIMEKELLVPNTCSCVGCNTAGYKKTKTPANTFSWGKDGVTNISKFGS
ncbi:hypothetical protein AMK59_6840, partial [Oryctes borbonicus]